MSDRCELCGIDLSVRAEWKMVHAGNNEDGTRPASRFSTTCALAVPRRRRLPRTAAWGREMAQHEEFDASDYERPAKEPVTVAGVLREFVGAFADVKSTPLGELLEATPRRLPWSEVNAKPSNVLLIGPVRVIVQDNERTMPDVTDTEAAALRLLAAAPAAVLLAQLVKRVVMGHPNAIDAFDVKAWNCFDLGPEQSKQVADLLALVDSALEGSR